FKWVWGLGLCLSLVALTLTLTRSAWVGLVVGACLILLLYKPLSLLLVPVAAGLFFAASPQHIQKRALSIFNLRNSTNQLRIEYFQAGLKIIGDFPLWGTGPDTVDMVFKNPQYGLSRVAKDNVHLHNNILQIGAERGLPALAAWLTFMVWTFFSLIRLLRNKDPPIRPFAASALAALLALAAAGLFEYNFADSEVIALFLFILTIPFAQEKGK
nr:O-antigen ligase family protein [bacterium]